MHWCPALNCLNAIKTQNQNQMQLVQCTCGYIFNLKRKNISNDIFELKQQKLRNNNCDSKSNCLEHNYGYIQMLQIEKKDKSNESHLKDMLIESNKSLIESKNQLIESKDEKIKELSTKLVHREGFLNSRGILERCERNYCSKAMLDGFSRFQRWVHILKNSNSLSSRIFKKIKLENQTKEQKISFISNKIVNLYEYLSNKIHNAPHSEDALVISSELTIEEIKIIALVCNDLNVNWQSSVLDKRFRKLNKTI